MKTTFDFIFFAGVKTNRCQVICALIKISSISFAKLGVILLPRVTSLFEINFQFLQSSNSLIN